MLLHIEQEVLCLPAQSRMRASTAREILYWIISRAFGVQPNSKSKGRFFMASFNKVVLLGNLTRDPELRFTAGKKAVCDVGIAINDRVKRNDEWTEEVTFVDVTFWGRTAEVVNQYLTKGSPVLVEGKLKLEQWEKDGQKRSKLKVIAERMQMLGKSPSNEATDEAELAGVGSGEEIPY